MLKDPGLFADCIRLAFKPHGKTHTDETSDESLKEGALMGWTVLQHGRGVAGQQSDGTVDRVAFDEWIQRSRELGVEYDRQASTDIVIGEWLSARPADADQSWPCSVVRDLLERDDAADIRSGFATGTFNNRGVARRRGWWQPRARACTAVPVLRRWRPEDAARHRAIARPYCSGI